MTTRTSAIILAAALAAVGAKAEPLDETDVRAAAVAFVNRDMIGASVLAGRQVASVTARDALWVVRLSPSGYVVFSGDTAAEPVVAFSANDYVEPPRCEMGGAARRAGRNLVGETWADTNAVNRAGLRFFRVRVEPK